MAVIKFLTHSPDPLAGVKGQIFKFCNNSVSCQYFLPKFRMQTEVQYCRYKTYQTGLLFEGPGYGSLGRLKGSGRVQSSTLSEYGHVAYQIKAIEACINLVANILPKDPLPRSWGWGQRSKFNFFRTWSCCISN